MFLCGYPLVIGWLQKVRWKEILWQMSILAFLVIHFQISYKNLPDSFTKIPLIGSIRYDKMVR